MLNWAWLLFQTGFSLQLYSIHYVFVLIRTFEVTPSCELLWARCWWRSPEKRFNYTYACGDLPATSECWDWYMLCEAIERQAIPRITNRQTLTAELFLFFLRFSFFWRMKPVKTLLNWQTFLFHLVLLLLGWMPPRFVLVWTSCWDLEKFE